MRDTNQPFALNLSKGERFFGCIPANVRKNRRVHFLYAVIPAKAGIQALNGIARSARDLKT